MSVVDEGLAALHKFDLLSGVVTGEFIQHQKAVTDKIKTATKSVDLNIRQCRALIATSNASISTIYVAIQSVREVDQGTSAAAKQRDDGMTQAMIRSSAESLNIRPTLKKAVEDQISAYQDLLALMSELLPRIGELFHSKVGASLIVIENDPSISGSRVNSNVTFQTPGIAATGDSMVPVSNRLPERLPLPVSTLSSPSPQRSPISYHGGYNDDKVVGSMYMKAPGKSEQSIGSKRR